MLHELERIKGKYTTERNDLQFILNEAEGSIKGHVPYQYELKDRIRQLTHLVNLIELVERNKS